MRFTLGDVQYVVCIAPRPLILGGQPCLAQLDRERQRIFLSDQLPRGQRRKELFHELRHAWVDVHGLPIDEEADAVNAGNMMDWLMDQYLQQGGDDTLERLDPLPDTPLNKNPSGRLFVVEAQCKGCLGPIAIGSIATSEPRWNVDLGNWVVDRGVCCECDAVTVWTELSTAEGMPTGAIVPWPPPRALTGTAKIEWLNAHKDVSRVMIAS